MFRRVALILLLALPAAAQVPDDRGKAELLGALTATRLDVDIREAPARDVFAALSRAIGKPIIGRYADDRVGHGLEPAMPIFLELTDVSALDVLEQVVEQSSLYEETTWQLRKGFIEVGTKQRLSTPAAGERRTHEITDLTITPPTFSSPGAAMPSIREYDDHPYKAASLSPPPEPRLSSFGGGEMRDTADVLALQIVQMIIQMVEPGNWDYGQFDQEDVGQPRRTERSPRDARPRRSVPLKIASIRRWRKQLLITAPDFIHRQVGGYPRPIAPRRIDEETLEARTAAATSEKITITVRGVDAARGRVTFGGVGP